MFSTLEAAIKHIEGHSKWGARVVYGDTDSVFVLLRGFYFIVTYVVMLIQQ